MIRLQIVFSPLALLQNAYNIDSKNTRSLKLKKCVNGGFFVLFQQYIMSFFTTSNKLGNRHLQY